MAQNLHTNPPLGHHAPPSGRSVSASEWIAIVLCLIWAGMVAAFFLTYDWRQVLQLDSGTPLQWIVIFLAIFLPVALILTVTSAARSTRIMREESYRMQVAFDSMRQSFLAETQARGMGVQMSVERKLEEIAQAARQTENVVATFSSSRDATPVLPRPAPADLGYEEIQEAHQPALELGPMPADAATPVPNDHLIRALNFPNSNDDGAGFAALRHALADRNIARVVHTAQTILTALAEDGIFMDDLRPDKGRPELWRRFARGERGAMVATIGAVRDRSSLALSAGRMRQDLEFRDATHEFLRRYDGMLQTIEPELSDTELAALADTRSAKAFMLLGRVTGIFD